MAEITFICPDCGSLIPLIYGANADANLAQLVAQTQTQLNGQARVAHDFDLRSSSAPKAGATPRPKTKPQYNAQFLAFWAAYPLHRDKRKACSAWRNAIARLGANADANGGATLGANATLIAGATRYRDDPNRRPEFTKYAEGWLNGDGWEDEPLPAHHPQGRPEPSRPMDATLANLEIERAYEEMHSET